MIKILVLTIFASFTLAYTYTPQESECQKMTKNTFKLSDRNIIADVEKYLTKLSKAYNKASLDPNQKLQMEMDIGEKVLRARSSFSNLYCGSEFHERLSTKAEQTFAINFPYFAGMYNVKVAHSEKDRISMMLSFGLGLEGGLSSFQIANNMAKSAISHNDGNGQRTVNTILFNSNGENATLEEVLEVIKSTKGRFIFNGYPKLGLITPVAEGGSQSICKNASDVEEQEIFEIVKHLHQIFVGPVTCSEKGSVEECVSHVIRSVEDCSNRINKSRDVNHEELLPLGILTTTTSFGKDYLARGKYWCLLSEYAEETGRQVIMLDEDGFIRDYVEESLNWDKPQNSKYIYISGSKLKTAAMGGSFFVVVFVIFVILICIKSDQPTFSHNALNTQCCASWKCSCCKL